MAAPPLRPELSWPTTARHVRGDGKEWLRGHGSRLKGRWPNDDITITAPAIDLSTSVNQLVPLAFGPPVDRAELGAEQPVLNCPVPLKGELAGLHDGLIVAVDEQVDVMEHVVGKEEEEVLLVRLLGGEFPVEAAKLTGSRGLDDPVCALAAAVMHYAYGFWKASADKGA
ncbi:hypothetical protein ColTof4_14327 [Colletotrichum tofieldiae]|nr:hypothetical protein ColTof3_14737 [Colletotrichum tofieldiae]GKT81904.1 hypothetical protein ColTof4_14327 [Colletotrichum tofieldiae]